MSKKLKLFLIISIFGMGIVQFSGCLQFRKSPKKVEKIFGSKGFEVHSKTIRSGDRDLHFIRTNFSDSLKPIALFIHGSPGSSDNYNDNLMDTLLRQHYEMISVDRPGFGYSDFGKSMPSLKEQSKFICALIDSFPNRKIVLVGHSYGGPLIVQMAMDYPSKISGLVIVAGSVDPDLEPEEWWRKPADSWFGRFITPKILEVSNQEIITLKSDLIAMKPNWDNITQPVCILQGEKDNLVPPGNADYAKKMLTNSAWVKVNMIPEMNHFIPFTTHHLITDALILLKAEIDL